MSDIKPRHSMWAKELDDKLLKEIALGKNSVQLTISMDMCYPAILRRLKQMGFENLRDARKVLTD
jgi:hypothetical protein